MVEADIHLRLLPTSILAICKVFEHIDMLPTGKRGETHPHDTGKVGSDLGTLVHLWSQDDAIT